MRWKYFLFMASMLLALLGPIIYFNGTISGEATKVGKEYECRMGYFDPVPQEVLDKKTREAVYTCTKERPYCNPISAAEGVIDCCESCGYTKKKITCTGCDYDANLMKTVGNREVLNVPKMASIYAALPTELVVAHTPAETKGAKAAAPSKKKLDWDSQNIVYIDRDKLYLTNHGANPAKYKIYDSGKTIASPEWSPDGTKIVFIERTADKYYIKTIDKIGAIATRLTINSPHPDVRSIYNPTWTEDGKAIYYKDYSRDSVGSTQNQDTGEVSYMCQANLRLMKLDLVNNGFTIVKYKSFFTSAAKASGAGSCRDEDVWEDALDQGTITCEGDGAYRPFSVNSDGVILANEKEFSDETCIDTNRYLALIYPNGDTERIGDAVGDADWFCDGSLFVYYGDLNSGEGVYTKDLNSGIVKTVDANEVTNTVAISDKQPIMDINIVVGGLGLYDYEAGTPKRNLGVTGADADFKVTRWPCK